ncbi:outer membrane beta-barrel protein [Aliidiomarina sanyensis]|uniref:Outer membrane protein beta-barrel domain-containing protein n=1 Tax=Aliidiomarina sanyensis TaxID=1249555 RepID=A0A432WNW9_9GAMM|nr:outer membrane beta-barrel protein [Aliidiomarina sanyensis]RUO35409.1 hypothetical protein CWE11_05200 [Aliidiomarina sanyensis]
MKTRAKHWLQATGIASLLLVSGALVAPATAQAQAFERDWMFSVNAGRASLDRYDQGSTWDSITDESGTIYGASLSYLLNPNLAVRVGYESSDSFSTQNACPVDAEACTLVAINERGTLRHTSVTLVPEMSLGQQVDLFGIIGVGRTQLSAGPQLSNYSSNDLVYGAGLGYRVNNWIYLSTELQRAGSDYTAARVSLGIRF